MYISFIILPPHPVSTGAQRRPTTISGRHDELDLNVLVPITFESQHLEDQALVATQLVDAGQLASKMSTAWSMKSLIANGKK